jgi:hypothetical protein
MIQWAVEEGSSEVQVLHPSLGLECWLLNDSIKGGSTLKADELPSNRSSRLEGGVIRPLTETFDCSKKEAEDFCFKFGKNIRT